METSHPLSIESFSYSWLVNLKPSLESLESSFRITSDLDANSDIEASSYIEMDPRMPPSKRFFKNSQQDFKFDFQISQNSPLVDADELFSNGYLMPLFVESMELETTYNALDKNPSFSSSSSSSHVPKKVVPSSPRSPSLKRCRTLSRKMFLKYLNFLRPLCRRLRGQNKSGSNHETVVKRSQSVKNRGRYSESSPRISVAYSADEWRKSCDSDSSIYEAVLHCKRSIERMS